MTSKVKYENDGAAQPHATVEHHVEPVDLIVGGVPTIGNAWLSVTIEQGVDPSEERHRSPVPSSEGRGSRAERWVVIAGKGDCTVIHASSSLCGPQVIRVEAYRAPSEVFEGLRGLPVGTDYGTVRALSLCDLLESNVLFDGKIPRWEEDESEVPPFKQFEAAELFPQVIGSLNHPMSPVGVELEGLICFDRVEAVGISVASEELDRHTGETAYDIRLRLVVGGVDSGGRIRVRVAADLLRKEINASIRDPREELRRVLWPDSEVGWDVVLDHLWLCDPILPLSQVLSRAEPGRSMGPLSPTVRVSGNAFWDFGWAQMFFTDWNLGPATGY